MNKLEFFFENENLTVIAGEDTKKADVEKVFEHSIDSVIVGLGGRTSQVSETMLTEIGSIARADVVQFCLDAVITEDLPYLKESPCISSIGGTLWQKTVSGPESRQEAEK